MRKRDIAAAIFLTVVFTLLALSVSLPADGTKAQTVGDCIQVLLNGEVQFEYGVCGVEIPTATPTDIPTEPTFTPTQPAATNTVPAPTSTLPAPTATVPVPPTSTPIVHDYEHWHPALPGVGHHGANPNLVNDIFGTWWLDVTGGEVHPSWQPRIPEVWRKHAGLVWFVERDLPCDSRETQACVTDYRVQTHILSDVFDQIGNDYPIEGSYHVFRAEMRVCLESNPDDCGIIRVGGRQYLGDIIVDSDDEVPFLNAPQIRALYEVNNTRAISLNYYDTGSRQFSTWYPVHPNGLFRLAVQVGDVWSYIDPEDPMRLNLDNGRDQSRMKVEVLSAQFPPRVMRIINPEGNRHINYLGYVDVNGFFVEDCTPVTAQCIPISYENVPVPDFEGFQYNGPFVEFNPDNVDIFYPAITGE